MSKRLCLTLTVILILGCNESDDPLRPAAPQSDPTWVDELIEHLENQPVWNPPAVLIRCEYQGEIVYYLPPHCCDIPAILFSEQGEVICHPSGGISGQGDGKCPDFYDERTNEEIIWKDPRPYPPKD